MINPRLFHQSVFRPRFCLSTLENNLSFQKSFHTFIRSRPIAVNASNCTSYTSNYKSPIVISSNTMIFKRHLTISNNPPEKLSFSQLTRKYGTLAIGVYLSLSFVVFCGCFISITMLGITSKDIKRVLDNFKRFIGIKPETLQAHESTAFDNLFKKLNIQDPNIIQFITNFFLAFAMTKLFSPFKIVACAFIVPGLARKLQRMGLDLGTRNIRQVAKDAGGRMRNRNK